VVVVGGGCGGSAKPERAVVTTQPVRTCKAGTFQRLGSLRIAYAAIVRSTANVSAHPGGRGFATFGRLNVNRVPTIFSIRGVRFDAACRASYLVQVPRRPNGVTGWVPANQVQVETVRT